MVITMLFRRWAMHFPKLIVLLSDEVDALVGDTLVSLLVQVRDGYIGRPIPFPHSVLLCGVRDIGEYSIFTAKQGIIYGGSCFYVRELWKFGRALGMRGSFPKRGWRQVECESLCM